ncbi:MAG: HEAT repeat domain-containing protein, partial [Opitutae bacterium]
FRAALKKSKGDSKLRQNSLHGLAQLSDKSSTPEFIKALSDKDEDTRLLGLWGLSQVADPKTLEPFLAADKKETGYARNQSAHLGFKFAEKLSKKDASKVYQHIIETRKASTEKHLVELAKAALN